MGSRRRRIGFPVPVVRCQRARGQLARTSYPMGGGSIAGNGVGVRELGWCAGGVPRVAKKREKAKRKLRPPFFHSIGIIAISRKRYGTSPYALHAVIAPPPFGTRPVKMRMHARRRRDSDCTAKICVLGGAFAGSKRGDFIFAIFFRDFLPFSPHPNDFERVLDI